MNLQKEQEHLIEFLEEALAEARLHPPSDRGHVDEIENELQEVLKEYKRLSVKDQSQERVSKQSTTPTRAAAAYPSISLLLQREGWLGSFLSNLRTLLSRQPSIVKTRRIPPEPTAFDESSKWLERVWSNAKAVCRKAPKVYAGPRAEALRKGFRFNENSWRENLFSNLKVLLLTPKSSELAMSAEPVAPAKVFED